MDATEESPHLASANQDMDYCRTATFLELPNNGGLLQLSEADVQTLQGGTEIVLICGDDSGDTEHTSFVTTVTRSDVNANGTESDCSSNATLGCIQASQASERAVISPIINPGAVVHRGNLMVTQDESMTEIDALSGATLREPNSSCGPALRGCGAGPGTSPTVQVRNGEPILEPAELRQKPPPCDYSAESVSACRNEHDVTDEGHVLKASPQSSGAFSKSCKVLNGPNISTLHQKVTRMSTRTKPSSVSTSPSHRVKPQSPVISARSRASRHSHGNLKRSASCHASDNPSPSKRPSPGSRNQVTHSKALDVSDQSVTMATDNDTGGTPIYSQIRHSRKQSSKGEVSDAAVKKPFQCELCEAQFVQKRSLTEHLTTHSGQRPHVCVTCQARFSRAGALRKHLRTHSGRDKPFACPVCNSRFQKAFHVKSHMTMHSNESNNVTTAKTDMKSEGSSSHKMMSASSPRVEEWNIGKMDGTPLVETGGRRVSARAMHPMCWACKSRFNSSEELEAHRETHHRGNTRTPVVALPPKTEARRRHKPGKPPKGRGPNKHCQKSVLPTERTSEEEMITGDAVMSPRHDEENYERPKTTNVSLLKNISRNDLKGRKSTFVKSKTFRGKGHKRQTSSAIVNKKVFRCVICHASFHRMSTLYFHRRTHERNSLRCKDCHASFGQAVTLRRHARTHIKQQSYVCRTCHAVFTLKLRLRFHILRHHAEKSDEKRLAPCDLSPKMFDTKKSLHANLRDDRKKKQNKVHTCKTCTLDFPSVGLLRKHRLSHPRLKPCRDPRPMACPPCDAVFPDEASLKQHLKSHGPQRRFICSICQSTYTEARSLREHLRIHTGEKPYTCETCGTTFRFASALRRHSRTHTGERPHKCNVCEATFTVAASLHDHMAKHMGIKRYQCAECDAAFTHGSSLRSHRRTHSGAKPYQCGVCAASFKWNSNLRYHMKLHDGGRRGRGGGGGGGVRRRRPRPKGEGHDLKRLPQIRLVTVEGLGEPPSGLHADPSGDALQLTFSVDDVTQGSAFRAAPGTASPSVLYVCQTCQDDDAGDVYFEDSDQFLRHVASHRDMGQTAALRSQGQGKTLPSEGVIHPITSDKSPNPLCGEHDEHAGGVSTPLSSGENTNSILRPPAMGVALPEVASPEVASEVELTYSSADHPPAEVSSALAQYPLEVEVSVPPEGNPDVAEADVRVEDNQALVDAADIEQGEHNTIYVVSDMELGSHAGGGLAVEDILQAVAAAEPGLGMAGKPIVLTTENGRLEIHYQQPDAAEEAAAVDVGLSDGNTQNVTQVQGENYHTTTLIQTSGDRDISTGDGQIQQLVELKEELDQDNEYASVAQIVEEKMEDATSDTGIIDDVSGSIDSEARGNVHLWKTNNENADEEEEGGEGEEEEGERAGSLSGGAAQKPDDGSSTIDSTDQRNSLVCDICKATFTRESSLKRHMLGHGKSLPFACNMCPATFVRALALKNHLGTHTGDRPYKCKECPAAFNYGSCLRTHARVHTGEKPHRCTHCPAKFQWPNTLRTHLLKAHADVTIFDEWVAGASAKPQVCDVCHKPFASSGSLKTHMRTHSGERPYACDLCAATFAHSGSLKDHQLMHTDAKPFTCGVCSKRFRRRVGLQIHARSHTGEKPFQCQKCGASFKDHGSLKYHLAVHSGEKPYRCDACGASFIRATTLRRHVRTHTKTRPFHCEFCAASFTAAASLNDHRMKHMGLKPHKCTICTAAFSRSSCLRAHVARHAKGMKGKARTAQAESGQQAAVLMD